MPARWRHLINDAVQSSDAATYSTDLPTAGALHALLVTAKITNGSTAGRNVGVLDAVDEIRIRGDGEDPIKLLHPQEVEKWYETLWGKALPGTATEAASAVQQMTFPVLFGRRLWDPEMFLPLERFKTAALEIDYSPTIAADAGFTTGTFTVDVMALISEAADRLSYRGTLKHRRIKSFTSAASGEDTTELPDTALIRAIGVYMYENQVDDLTDITRVRLEDRPTGKALVDFDINELYAMNEALFGAEITHLYRLLAQNADVLDTRLGRPTAISLRPIVAAEIGTDTNLIATISAITGDRLTLDASIVTETTVTTPEAADTTDRRYQVAVRGLTPSYFALLPYMYPDDESGYLPVERFGGLNLILTQAGAGATVRVSVEELVKY